MSSVSMINGHIDGPKGLTDEDIIKALECCGVKQDCEGCPYREAMFGSCEDDIKAAAFALINRKNETIETLITGRESLMKHLERKKELITELDAEVERLQKEVDRLCKRNGGQNG